MAAQIVLNRRFPVISLIADYAVPSGRNDALDIGSRRPARDGLCLRESFFFGVAPRRTGKCIVRIRTRLGAQFATTRRTTLRRACRVNRIGVAVSASSKELRFLPSKGPTVLITFMKCTFMK
jgi:hypothetical protein